jgi:hypothetical protein
MTTTMIGAVTFPSYSGIRCLMMPYVQGDPESVPDDYEAYRDIISAVYLAAGDTGFLTIDESPAVKGKPHRGDRARFGRALHTEAGLRPHSGQYGWGGGGWGSSPQVALDPDTGILLANSLDDSCAIWDATHPDTSEDGDIGDKADLYPYADATFLRAGDVHRIGILTPHESLPVAGDCRRQFLRIVGDGVRGREPYFTVNPLFDAGRGDA